MLKLSMLSLVNRITFHLQHYAYDLGHIAGENAAGGNVKYASNCEKYQCENI